MGKIIEQFLYVVKHKQGKEKVVADALSRRHALLFMAETKILDVELFKELYDDDHVFLCVKSIKIEENELLKVFTNMMIFLLKELSCVCKGSMRELFINVLKELLVSLNDASTFLLISHLGIRETIWLR